jgi:hypothetical protein
MESSLTESMPLFSSTAFSFLESISACPTKEFYTSHKTDFIKEVQEPLKNLFGLVEQRLPKSMLDGLETKKRLMSQILKNDYGAGGAHDHLWGAFYKKGEKRISSPQLYITIAKDHLSFGFYIGENDRKFQRTFAKNCKKPEIRSLSPNFDNELRGSNIQFGTRKPNHPVAIGSFHEFQSFGDWFDAVDEVGAGVRVVLTKEEVFSLQPDQLADKVANTFKALYPLFQIASENITDTSGSNSQNELYNSIPDNGITGKMSEFENYLNKILKRKDSASHYIRSLNTLSGILKSEKFGFQDCANLWYLDSSSISRLRELLAYLKEQLKLGSMSPLAELDIPKYYLKDRFFSAAVGNYIDFLSNKTNKELQNWTWAAGENAVYWDEFYESGMIAIGWDSLGDLSQFKSKEEIQNKLQELGGDTNTSSQTNNALACWEFVHVIQEGDIIFSKKGNNTILGYGIVEGAYEFDSNRESFKNTRKVRWVQKGKWILPDGKLIAIKALTNITEYKDFVNQIEALVGLKSQVSIPIEIVTNPQYSLDQCAADSGFSREDIAAWVRAIQRKGQAIVYGAPGTGKTFIAEKLSKHLIGESDGFYDLVQFHPAYSYEDFIEGIRPATNGGQLSYAPATGRFLDFCKKAEERDGICVLIIDEINRANLSRVFGELMYLLEYRDKEMVLAGGTIFRIPKNVRIIGTMNTADRSIALVDHALRRRFSFIPLSPRYEVIESFHEGSDFNPSELIKVLKSVNALINDKHYHIGISFFLREDLRGEISDIWNLEIEPYLEEFFFDQQEKMEQFRWSKIESKVLGA